MACTTLAVPDMFEKKTRAPARDLADLSEKDLKHAAQKRINAKLHYDIKKEGGFVMEKWGQIQAMLVYVHCTNCFLQLSNQLVNSCTNCFLRLNDKFIRLWQFIHDCRHCLGVAARRTNTRSSSC